MSDEFKIPEYIPSFEEVSKQMRINVDILKKELSDHIDFEIRRFKEKIISSEGSEDE